MTRARTKALHDKVNSLLCSYDLNTPLDGLLPHSDMLCVLSYDPHGVPQDGQAPEDQTDGSKGQRGEGEMPAKSAVLPPYPSGTTADPVAPEETRTGTTAFLPLRLPPTFCDRAGVTGSKTGATAGTTAGLYTV